jgi:UDP-N-acetylmuramyl pentapeptide phosphotransferase/UDP-N-acetylglucosamine-1-phosphate transferase/glycosyltransferase involved in cell wall biosynthesis
MKTYFFVYFGAMLLAWLLTPLIVRLAKRFQLLDKPSARKVHATPTPRLGGVALLISTLAMIIPVLLLPNLVGATLRDLHGRVGVVLGASIVVFLVGLLDDIWGIKSPVKLLVIGAAAAAVCGTGATINSIDLGTRLHFEFGMLAWPMTLMWIVGVTVSVNFIDGLDGLAAGISAIACGVIAAVAMSYGQMVTAVLAMSLLGSLSGFLFHNRHPATIFMGDCGSMTIGFLIASSSVLCASTAQSFLGVLLPAIALAIPILDAIFTMIRRGILQRRPLFAAERGHIHHRLLDLGMRHRHVVYVLCGITFCTTSLAVFLFLAHARNVFLIASVLMLPLFLFRLAGMARLRKTLSALKKNYFRNRATNDCKDVFAEMALKLRGAKSFAEWWDGVCAAAHGMGLARLSIPLSKRDGSTQVLMWSLPNCDLSADEVIVSALPIQQRRAGTFTKCEIAVSARESLEMAGQRCMLFSRLLDEHSLANLPFSLRRVRGLAEDSAPGLQNIPQEPISELIKSLQKRKTRSAKSPATEAISHQEITSKSSRKIAVVHDFLYTYAGAERVLEQILEEYPEADVFSLFDFLPPEQRGFLKGRKVTTSFIQKMPLARTKHRAYLPFMPFAIEQLDVSEYDIVISSSYLAAKGVLTRADQLHVCYCHTPVRFAWDLQKQYLAASGLVSGVKSLLARVILHYIRSWDTHSANRVDRFITNSHYVADRIGKIYRRESTVVYPPVDVEGYQLHTEKDDFYLTVSRLVPYKKIDLIVETFTRMKDRRLIVIGDGPDMEKIRAKAGPNVTLLGFQPAEHVREYMQRAKAFVFAAEEDFGIVPVEAQACGTPVIAYARGGVTESVIDGRTGAFFRRQTVESVEAAILEFEANEVGWNPKVIRNNAERFSAERFRREFREIVERDWLSFIKRHSLPAARSQEVSTKFGLTAPVFVDAPLRPTSGDAQDLPTPQGQSQALGSGV